MDRITVPAFALITALASFSVAAQFSPPPPLDIPTIPPPPPDSPRDAKQKAHERDPNAVQPEGSPLEPSGEAVKMPAETLDSVGLRKSGHPVIVDKQPDEPPPPEGESQPPPKKKAGKKAKPPAQTP